MVKRRAQDAGISTEICNHIFRGTGITNYLERGGSRDIAPGSWSRRCQGDRALRSAGQ
ncbi:hypothetical protein [Adonisia turfae]|uniref:hypothetical protein n=1 Tax=Adonisia turfae TaxID=2950184 RepID=UPI0013D0FF85|nr:hypothetical protein [Adonisia turfae]